MPQRSAGLVLFRRGPDGLEVLLGHPGGPYYRDRDEGTWGIFKGETDGELDALAVARREFEEETGHPARRWAAKSSWESCARSRASS